MLIYGVEVPEWALLGTAATGLAYWYSTRTFGYFKSKGIPGPRPYPMIGTLGTMYGQSAMETDEIYQKKYGKFVGTYEGTYVNLVVFDPEFCKEAFIKHFDAFTNRRVIRLGGPMDYSLLNLSDDHWKYVRSTLSPTFTQGKLKGMLPHIQRCADIFVEVIGTEKDGLVDVRKRTYGYTTDVIATTAFGLDVNTQKNPDSPFLRHARAMIDAFEVLETLWQKIKFTFVVSLIFLAPGWLVTALYDYFKISSLGYDTMMYFEGLVKSALKERMTTAEPGHDFVQTMADSVNEVKKSDPDALKDKDGLVWSKKGLTMNEIVGNAVVFILAGFQTTADTLLFLFYELAMYPDIQQRVYEEIDSICDEDELSMSQIQQLKYLDNIVNETLRLYPQAFRFDREATKDITVRGIPIKKGMAVTVSPWVIHRDPEFWQDPLEFNPDRFLPENSADRPASAFIPFGIGNRSCIGNRLALLEMKVVVIQALKKYRIEKCEETIPRPVKFKATAAITPEKPIIVKFADRSH